MKKFIFSFTIGLIIIAFPFVGNAQNTITLNALPGGTEGTTTYSDSSILSINAFGGVTYKNSNTTDDWGVTASTVTPSGALNKTFGVTIGGMSTVNTTEGRNYGQKLTDGGIDRASDGSLGIRSGLGGGIDNNEGLNFGLDLTSLSSTASIQITKIYVRFAGGTGESGVLVSRLNPSIRIVFGNSTTAGVNFPVTDTETAIDVSSFSLYGSGSCIQQFTNGEQF
jgi:hypothetical protein